MGGVPGDKPHTRTCKLHTERPEWKFSTYLTCPSVADFLPMRTFHSFNYLLPSFVAMLVVCIYNIYYNHMGHNKLLSSSAYMAVFLMRTVSSKRRHIIQIWYLLVPSPFFFGICGHYPDCQTQIQAVWTGARTVGQYLWQERYFKNLSSLKAVITNSSPVLIYSNKICISCVAWKHSVTITGVTGMFGCSYAPGLQKFE